MSHTPPLIAFAERFIAANPDLEDIFCRENRHKKRKSVAIFSPSTRTSAYSPNRRGGVGSARVYTSPSLSTHHAYAITISLPSADIDLIRSWRPKLLRKLRSLGFRGRGRTANMSYGRPVPPHDHIIANCARPMDTGAAERALMAILPSDLRVLDGGGRVIDIKRAWDAEGWEAYIDGRRGGNFFARRGGGHKGFRSAYTFGSVKSVADDTGGRKSLRGLTQNPPLFRSRPLHTSAAVAYPYYNFPLHGHVHRAFFRWRWPSPRGPDCRHLAFVLFLRIE